MVEVILYTSLAAIVLGSFIILHLSWLNLANQAEAAARLNANSLFALRAITHLVKSAEAIIAPAKGQASGQIELVINGQTARIYASAGSLYYTLATSSPQRLTETGLAVSSFAASRAGVSGQDSALKIDLSLELPNFATTSWQTVVCQRLN